MLSVIMLSIIMLIAIMLSAIMLSAIMSAIIRSSIMECHYAECHYSDCVYAEYHYAEKHLSSAIMLSIILMSVIMLSVLALCKPAFFTCKMGGLSQNHSKIGAYLGSTSADFAHCLEGVWVVYFLFNVCGFIQSLHQDLNIIKLFTAGIYECPH